ncbi:hypothetical protein [Streptomyces sp. NPDC048419]|uniref:CIS tube protein n=1 Tax=Streptomyces sp. NPDC048419 TaxID=3365547 RepID=UPI0037186EA1
MVDIRQWSRVGHDKAKIVSLNPLSPGMVLFDYNPERIMFNRTAQTLTRNTSTGSSGSILTKAELATISISKICLVGADTKNRCDRLLGWASPPSGIKEKILELYEMRVELPVLTFQWGPPMVGFFYQVVLTRCDVSYTRFGEDGEPSRADVSLTMREQPSLVGSLPTNPTSGGLAGRTAHEMCEGENLVNIAAQRLGHPGRWRDLAEANGLDDPLRLRPGTSVYVPNPQELPAEGG